MKKIITAMFVVTLLAGSAYAQWDFVSQFPPPDGIMGGSGAHGLAVDPDGKVWFQFYGATDSILQADGTYGACRILHVFNADGTPAAITGIKVVTVDGVPDTLWNSGRGLGADNNGNILACHYDEIYRINYQTGEGMNYFEQDAMSLTAPSCDDNGNVIVAILKRSQ